jgi:hypothetical protein
MRFKDLHKDMDLKYLSYGLKENITKILDLKEKEHGNTIFNIYQILFH